MPTVYRPIVLAILDGWGYSKHMVGNAVSNAKKPNLNKIEKEFPSLLLQASGLAVGMAWGEAGNSEVGHLTIGAGRTILQYLIRINRDIESGHFFENKELIKAFEHTKKNSSTLHILGLLGSGSVHSYFNHILALLELIRRNDISNYHLHLFTDGKDSGFHEAASLLNKVEEYIPGSISHLATLIGRDYAMDRNNHWDLTQKAYNLWVNGNGEREQDVYQAIENYYAHGFNDSNLPPTIFNLKGIIKDGDSLIFFNFREDSMRQSVKVFADEHFSNFNRRLLKNIRITSLSPYFEDTILHSVYPALYISNGLAEVISTNNKTQLHISETEKYAHVTYFFNCLKNKPFSGETDMFIPSKLDPLDNPEMGTDEITDQVIKELERQHYDFILINFANADTLAHFGNLEKTILGVEKIDEALGRLKNAVLACNGVMIATSDHGNAERVTYKLSGNPETKHDQSPVPLYLIGNDFRKQHEHENIDENISGLLSDIAPTILNLMNIEIPSEMNGVNLLEKLTR